MSYPTSCGFSDAVVSAPAFSIDSTITSDDLAVSSDAVGLSSVLFSLSLISGLSKTDGVVRLSKTDVYSSDTSLFLEPIGVSMTDGEIRLSKGRVLHAMLVLPKVLWDVVLSVLLTSEGVVAVENDAGMGVVSVDDAEQVRLARYSVDTEQSVVRKNEVCAPNDIATSKVKAIFSSKQRDCKLFNIIFVYGHDSQIISIGTYTL